MPDDPKPPADDPSPHETEFIIAFDENDDGETTIDVVQLDPPTEPLESEA